ncbi:MAG: hypothetical protein WCQ95_11240 [Bacteroidota bacterium]
MKKHKKISALVLLTALFLISGTSVFGQMKTFTWDSYKTKFKVPDNFVVDESTGEKWLGHNSDITLSIYPRKDENLSDREMRSAVRTWAVDNGVTNLGDAVDLDSEKLNGYNGVLYEGEKDGFPVATMLIIDPDYPSITIYIWVSYREGSSDTVLDLLMSFTPN